MSDLAYMSCRFKEFDNNTNGDNGNIIKKIIIIILIIITMPIPMVKIRIKNKVIYIFVIVHNTLHSYNT